MHLRDSAGLQFSSRIVNPIRRRIQRQLNGLSSPTKWQPFHDSKLILLPNLAYSCIFSSSILSLISLSWLSTADTDLSIFSVDAEINPCTAGKGKEKKASPNLYLINSSGWSLVKCYKTMWYIRQFLIFINELQLIWQLFQIFFLFLQNHYFRAVYWKTRDEAVPLYFSSLPLAKFPADAVDWSYWFYLDPLGALLDLPSQSQPHLLLIAERLLEPGSRHWLRIRDDRYHPSLHLQTWWCTGSMVLVSEPLQNLSRPYG